MPSLDDRHKRIIKKVNKEKLPFKILDTNFRDFASFTTSTLLHIFKKREENVSLKWCFSTVKKGKVFLKIFENNYLGKKMYKEELAKQLPEYSYKTIAAIVDEGVKKGIYVLLKPRVQSLIDSKIKNLRPSEEVAASFLNWYIEIINSIISITKKYK